MTLQAKWDVIILGAGASGLMCALTAGERGRRVLVLDHAKRAGEKVRISGGGHCNFTNLHTTRHHYLSANPRFCQSALGQFTPQHFLALLKKQKIRYHEKIAGQMFCDGSATEIVTLLMEKCQQQAVQFGFNTTIGPITPTNPGFTIETNQGSLNTTTLVVALGGCSMPKLGATGLGHEIARRFGLPIIPPHPGLTPLKVAPQIMQACQQLTGIAMNGTIHCDQIHFTDGLLFTHRGLSGPAILQISSYWQPGHAIRIDLAPGTDLFVWLKEAKNRQPKQALRTALAQILPKRLALHLLTQIQCDGRLAEIADTRLRQVADAVNRWEITPEGRLGYHHAEVTVGGVDTKALNPKTLECRSIQGLYFIGEVVDVTGWLGGFNLQWAWSSGYAAGRVA